MPFNDTAKNTALTAVAGTITHVGVLGSVTDPGTSTNFTGTETTGGSPAYARAAVTWAASASGLDANSNAMTIDVPAGTYAFLLLMNASTGNTSNYRGYIPFGGASALKGFFSVDATLTNDVLFSRGHGMADGDRVMLFNVFAETLPTGVAEGTVYFVVNSTTDSFKVSTTSGGAAVDITALGGGEGFWQRVVPEVFASQGQITIAAGALVLDATAM